jgi:hypothetical protein
MRVTKNVREYIEREVEKRLMPKYEVEKVEAKFQEAALNAFLEGASKAAEDAYYAYFEAHWSEISEFCESHIDNEYSRPHFYNSRAAALKDKCYYESIHCWDRRLRDEVKRVVADIIVTLELGGGRAELEEMLNNI